MRSCFPLGSDTFDGAVAQLVVHFMTDPVQGLRDVFRPDELGGVVAACVWDFVEGGSPLSPFWAAARGIDPAAPNEDALPGTRRGHLAQLLVEAGADQVNEDALSITVQHDTFEDWWAPFELASGRRARTSRTGPGRSAASRGALSRFATRAPFHGDGGRLGRKGSSQGAMNRRAVAG